MNYPTLFPSEVAPDFYIKEEYKLERKKSINWKDFTEHIVLRGAV